MKIYKYEFLVDAGNQHDYYNPRVTHVLHVLKNTKENREFFEGEVGVPSTDFIMGGSSDWFGYKITRIEVIE